MRLRSTLSSATSDPMGLDLFEVLPIPMPFESMKLLHHGTHFRLLTSTVVAKNPNASLAGLVTHNAATFRSFLLIAGIHHVWAGGSLQAIEETMLHHKLEAIRIVNGMIGDPVLSQSDTCISAMVGLAMVEAALGDKKAAEAHLKALARLYDDQNPEEDRAACLVAASKDRNDSESHYFVNEPRESPKRSHHYTRPTRPVFSAVPFLSLHLSPFYYATPPDLEACNADAECEIIAITLRRLSSFGSDRSAQSGEENNAASSRQQKARDTLREDVESYTVSLIFKPARPTRDNRSDSQARVQVSRLSSQLRRDDFEDLEDADDQFVTFLEHPFANLPPAIFPSTSRAWACAAYLYLHLVVDYLPQQQDHAQEPVNMDKHLWRWLISSLRQDLDHTEEAMRIGAQSSELWLWKAVLGAYAMAKNPQEASDEASSGDEDESDDQNRANSPGGRSSGRSSQVSSSSDIADMQWFNSKIRAWSAVVRTTSWDGAKKALSRIAWPEKFYDDDRLAELWDEAMESVNPE
ncbi:hypothetical protein TGAM01_v206094 [Trichoderma gamsii]|uniref:Uncharacterized protein n=1 Tax=Trichoderma gamsii TaxID=398673 RepID=A0A2P4ZL34_9HYPO|nr:hypothetical protein TGAM01_v206094 [Trichoderma gamsii]PON25013.1 hypothetical protein TGAM01_v206094 [Trichoderma gamsii]